VTPPVIDTAARTSDEYFGLTYSSYLVVPRLLLQSMPAEWQQQFFALLADLHDAFSDVLPSDSRYIVRPATECQYSDLNDTDMQQFGVTRPDGSDDGIGGTYFDAAGVEHDGEDLVLLPKVGEDPLGGYRRRSMAAAAPAGGWRHLRTPVGEVVGMAQTLTDGLQHLVRVAGGISEHVEARAAELTEDRVQVMMAEHARQRAKMEQTIQLAEDRSTELRGQIDMIERNYRRAAAALRASGITGVQGRAGGDVADEPSSDRPGEQIVFWLDRVMPPWPEDRELVMAGYCMTGVLEGEPKDNAAEIRPAGVSRVVPLGALITALKAVADIEPDATGRRAQTVIRNVLAGHGVPEAAERLHRSDGIQGGLQKRRS
jgi:hypothetical protein